MSRKERAKLLLTRRALDDLTDIEDYSTKRWGKRVANRYVGDIEASLARIADRSEILQDIVDMPLPLKCYRANRHLILCDARESTIVVLAVVHASMDVVSRIAELQPTLAAEAEMLHEKHRKRPRRRS